METYLAELSQRRDTVFQMGGAEKIQKQHEENKLTARERIALLVDSGSFFETGMYAVSQAIQDKPTPADGVITGVGKVDGRDVCICSYDFTVMGGSMGEIGERKVTFLRAFAVEKRLPFVWLLDSAGARIQEAMGSQFAGTGALFYEQSIMSGSIPMISAVMGPCAAGTAYIPGLSDVVFMVKGTGSMALAGARLVKAAIGEDVSDEDLGGSKVHNTISGCSDFETENDEDCIAKIKHYLSYFPSSCDDQPPRHYFKGEQTLPDSVLSILPDSPNKGFDMKAILALIVDEGKMLEVKQQFAPNIITALARIGGRPVGIVANQTKFFSGVIDCNASDKAARFITLCNAFNIPLVFFHDTPGFMVGSKYEREGIIRHGAKMIYAVSNATVPKISVVVRKSYGAGHYAMCGKAFGADVVVAWPTAEICVMGPEGAVNIIYKKYLDAMDNQEEAKEMRDNAIAEYRKLISPYVAGGHAYVEDIIDPRDTKRAIIRGLEISDKKTKQLPTKKCGIFPV